MNPHRSRGQVATRRESDEREPDERRGRMTFLRRTALALSLALLAAGAALGAAPGGASGAVRGTVGAPGNASAGDVERVLGVGKIPAAIVLIVDVTYSMDSR